MAFFRQAKPQNLFKRLVVTFLWSIGMQSFQLLPSYIDIGDLFLFSLGEVALFSVFFIIFNVFMLEYVVKEDEELNMPTLILILVRTFFINMISVLIVSRLSGFHLRLFHYLILEGLCYIATAEDKRGAKNG